MSQVMPNDETLKARANQPHEARREQQFVSRRISSFMYGRERLDCIKGVTEGKETKLDNIPISRTNVCSALMDADVATAYEFNLRNAPFSPFEAIGLMSGFTGASTTAPVNIARDFNAIMLRPENVAKPVTTPIEVTLEDVATGRKHTMSVKGGAAIEVGYLLAYSYYRNNMLDSLKLPPSFANLTQAKIEEVLQMCTGEIKGAATPTYGQCINVGAEQGVRSIPRIQAKIEADKKAR